MITFAVPEAGEVTLAIYNLRGQLVQTLHSGPIAAGYHSLVWNGTDFQGAKVGRKALFAPRSFPLSFPNSSLGTHMIEKLCFELFQRSIRKEASRLRRNMPDVPKLEAFGTRTKPFRRHDLCGNSSNHSFCRDGFRKSRPKETTKPTQVGAMEYIGMLPVRWRVSMVRHQADHQGRERWIGQPSRVLNKRLDLL